MVVLTSFTQPTDGVRHRQNNTTVYVNNNNLGKGTLYIAESCLSWVSDSGNGFSIEYPHISLHAVSRDLSSFPQECLFLMLDTDLGDEETINGNGQEQEEEDGNENDSDQGTTEIRLVPDDKGMLEAMFHAMNACQALHPDPEDSFSDDDFYEDADDEAPMDDTDHRMAGLRIENMDGTPHIGRGAWEEGMVGGMVGGMEEDMEEDMEKDNILIYRGGILGGDRVVGMEGGISADRVGDMEEGMGVGMVGGMVGGISVGRVVDRAVDRVVGISAGRVVDRAVDRVGGISVGRAAGMEVGMGADISVGRVADRAVGISADRVVDRVADRAVGISGGRVGGMEVGMGAGMEAGISVGRVADRVGGGTCILGGAGSMGAVDMARGDRSFALGNIGHPGRTAPLRTAHSTRMVLEEESNFSDAEN